MLDNEVMPAYKSCLEYYVVTVIATETPYSYGQVIHLSEDI